MTTSKRSSLIFSRCRPSTTPYPILFLLINNYVMKKFVVLLAVMLFLYGCGQEQGKDNPATADKTPSAPAGPTGRIRGIVRLQGDAPTATFEPIAENQNTCGDR